jgi:hypothetical protein
MFGLKRLFVYMGVRGKPRVYCRLLAYCTACFGRSNFGHKMTRAYRRIPKFCLNADFHGT